MFRLHRGKLIFVGITALIYVVIFMIVFFVGSKKSLQVTSIVLMILPLLFIAGLYINYKMINARKSINYKKGLSLQDKELISLYISKDIKNIGINEMVVLWRKQMLFFIFLTALIFIMGLSLFLIAEYLI